MRLRFAQFLSCGLFVMAPFMAQGETATDLAKEAETFYKAQKVDEAIAAYRQALALEPDSPVLQYNLGTALARKGQVEDATRVLHQSAADPGSVTRPDALFNLGTALAESAAKANGAGPAQAMPPTTQPGVVSPGAPQPQGDPLQQRIETLEKSLGAFREAILNDARPKARQEAQYNFEVTRQIINELKKQQQEQQQQNGQNQNQQQDKDKDKQQQDKNQQQQGQNQQQNQNQQQGQQGQQQNQDPNQQQQNQPQNGQGTPTPTPTPGPNGENPNQPGAQPTPSPTPGNQGQNQQQQEAQQKDQKEQQSSSQQQKGLEQQATPTPAPSPSPGAQGSAQKADAKPQQGRPPEDTGSAAQGVPAQETPTPEQLNAQRLLNLLEEEKPEQYKKLYQFHGETNSPPRKDW